eukprot:PhM_4_TR15619/c0_g2_i2/m.68488
MYNSLLALLMRKAFMPRADVAGDRGDVSGNVLLSLLFDGASVGTGMTSIGGNVSRGLTVTVTLARVTGLVRVSPLVRVVDSVAVWESPNGFVVVRFAVFVRWSRAPGVRVIVSAVLMVRRRETEVDSVGTVSAGTPFVLSVSVGALALTDGSFDGDALLCVGEAEADGDTSNETVPKDFVVVSDRKSVSLSVLDRVTSDVNVGPVLVPVRVTTRLCDDVEDCVGSVENVDVSLMDVVTVWVCVGSLENVAVSLMDVVNVDECVGVVDAVVVPVTVTSSVALFEAVPDGETAAVALTVSERSRVPLTESVATTEALDVALVEREMLRHALTLNVEVTSAVSVAVADFERSVVNVVDGVCESVAVSVAVVVAECDCDSMPVEDKLSVPVLNAVSVRDHVEVPVTVVMVKSVTPRKCVVAPEARAVPPYSHVYARVNAGSRSFHVPVAVTNSTDVSVAGLSGSPLPQLLYNCKPWSTEGPVRHVHVPIETAAPSHPTYPHVRSCAFSVPDMTTARYPARPNTFFDSHDDFAADHVARAPDTYS